MRPSWANPPAASSCDLTVTLDDVETGKGEAQGSNYVRTSCMARLRLQFTGSDLDVAFYYDNSSSLTESKIAFYVPSAGSWVETSAVASTGAKTETVTIPGSGSREVVVTNTGVMRNLTGAWLRSITPADGTLSRLPIASPTGKKCVVIYHDSLAIQVQSGTAAKECTLGLLRSSLSDTIVYSEGYGGRALAADDDDSFVALGKNIQGCAMAAGVAASDVIVLNLIGTNDFGLSSWASVASFQTAYGNLITKQRAVLPSARIVCTTILPRTTTTNANGQTIAQFRTAISDAEAASGDANTEVLDGTTLITDATTDCFDGLHLKNGPTVGHAKLAANLITALGLT